MRWCAPAVASSRSTAAGTVAASKPHDPEAYAGTLMADDVVALMDHLGIKRADLAGYSMGGLLSTSLLVRRPERFRSVILAGIGDNAVRARPAGDREAIASALSAPPGTRSENATARGFRVFAERSGNDLDALAAIQRSSRGGFDPRKIAETTLPVLVLIGEGDTLAGPADGLAAYIPGATLVKVPGDHLTAVGAPEFREAIVRFLGDRSPVPS